MTSKIKTSLLLIVIRSADIMATIDFYRALGLRLAREQHNSGPVHYSSIIDDLVFEIYPLKKGVDNNEAGRDSVMIGLAVDSLEAVLANLSEIGIRTDLIPKESEWGRWIKITDPDGRCIRISERYTAGA